MAVTANQVSRRTNGERAFGPVAEATHLYESTLCFFNSSGYVVADTNSGGNAFAGVVVHEQDNSAGANGALTAEFIQEGGFVLPGTGFSLATVGANIYAIDNYTVTTSAAGNRFIGKCIGFISSTQILVKLNVDNHPESVTTVDLGDDGDILLGTGDDAIIRWATGDASNHALVIGLGDSNQALHITDKAAAGTDWNVSATTHPNVYIHSNTTPATDYLRLGGHTGTAADIDVVGGTTLNLQIAGSTAAALTATTLAFAATCFPVLPITDTDGTVEGSIWYDASEDKLKFKTAGGVETITSS